MVKTAEGDQQERRPRDLASGHRVGMKRLQHRDRHEEEPDLGLVSATFVLLGATPGAGGWRGLRLGAAATFVLTPAALIAPPGDRALESLRHGRVGLQADPAALAAVAERRGRRAQPGPDLQDVPGQWGRRSAARYAFQRCARANSSSSSPA
jgi:hypothetical protein